jgi:hypothetical protein
VHGNPIARLPSKLHLFPESLRLLEIAQLREALTETQVADSSLLALAAAAEEVEWNLVLEAVLNPHEPNN